MARNRVKLVSKFPAVPKAGHEGVRHARDMALNVGELTAEQKLEGVDNKRGYELPIDIGQDTIGWQSGKISYDPFYGKYFEYGTVYIPAAPFMRPAHRKMRKEFLSKMDDDFEGFIRSKGVRPMSTINEEVAAQNYLVAYLEADSILSDLVRGIWLRSTPATAPFPVVKIDRQDGTDLMAVGLARVWADLSFLVRGIVHWRGAGQPDWTDSGAIADRLDTLLHDHEGQNSVVQVHAFREESFTDETLEPDLYLHAGGIYRLRARSAT